MGHREENSEHINPIFICCTSLPVVNLNHMKNLGKYIVKINDPRKLAEDINKYFISAEQKFLIEGCEVVYNKVKDSDRKLTNNEILDLSYKQKPERFRDDCEFRIIAIKLSGTCTDECKFLSGQPEQVDPKCKYIEINLGKSLDYTQLWAGE